MDPTNVKPGSRGARALRPRHSLAARLFLAVGLPSSLVVTGLAATAYVGARQVITDSLFREVSVVATVAATRVDPFFLAYLTPGSEGETTYLNQVRKLVDVTVAAGSTRAFVLDREGHVVVDSEAALPIGTEAPRAALDERELLLALGGTTTLSVPFSDARGHRFLRAYVPLRARDSSLSSYVLALEAPASILADTERIGRWLLVFGALFLVLTLALAVVVARTITRPLEELARGAAAVGEGQLDAPLVVPRGHDEVALLGHTLEEMRRGLKERDAERQMMLAGIAHEVRNPLGGMELFSGLLEEGLRELPEGTGGIPVDVKGELTGHAARVRRELRYLTGVVNDFLAFARETGITREPVEVRALVDEVVSLTARVGAAPVEAAVPPDLVFPLDRGRVKEALLNLVENALQASGPDAPVRVSARRDGDALVVEVADGGRGMSEETRARAFQPFFTTREKGSGLGLPLVRKFARDHGGDCVLASTVGAGTTVTLTLGPGAVDDAARKAAPDGEALLGDG